MGRRELEPRAARSRSTHIDPIDKNLRVAGRITIVPCLSPHLPVFLCYGKLEEKQEEINGVYILCVTQ